MRGLLALAGVAVLLSACTNEATKTSPEETGASSVVGPSESTAGQGGIAGLILDDEQLPVAAADIAITQPILIEAKSDKDGAFAFRGLEPGTYTLLASRLGYETAARRVDVMAGETADVRLVLKTVPIKVAYNQTQIKRGYWECDVPIALIVINCADARQFTGPRPDSVTFNVSSGWHTTWFELTWTETGPTGHTAPGVYCFTGAKDGTASGPARTAKKPLRVEFVANDEEDGGPKYQHYANCYPVGLYSDIIPTNGVGVVVDQTWTVYATTFYLEAPPKGFTALPPP